MSETLDEGELPVPLRVLHVTECCGGGVPQAIRDQVRITPAIEHHVAWQPCNSDRPPTGAVNLYDLPRGHLRQMLRARRLVSSVHPDLVVAHSTWAGFYLRIGSRLEAPIVYQPHAFAFANPSRRALARQIYRVAERLLVKRSAAVVAITAEEEALARAVGAVHVVRSPNSSQAHSDVGRGPVPEVLAVGRLSPQKDPLFFAEVARRVRRVLPEVSFTWIGAGDSRLADELVRADVEVTGWLDQQSVWDRMAGASVYVHTAVAEGFPLTVLDAAALEVPMVLRSIDAFSEFAEERLGDPDQVAQAVLEVLGGHDERAKAASERVRQLTSPDEHAARLYALYRTTTEAPCQR